MPLAFELKSLFEKYLRNSISETEFKRLFVLLEDFTDEEIIQCLQEIQASNPELGMTSMDEHIHVEGLNEKIGSIWNKLEEHAQTSLSISQEESDNVKHINPWKKYISWASVAAAILIIFGITWYNRPEKEITSTENPTLALVEPMENQSTLTLPNGKSIVIEDDKNGLLYHDETYIVSKGDNNEIVFELKDKTAATEEIAFSSIKTSTGGFTSFKLPDGSKVWLSSESSLRFPTQFASDKRVVYLDGEGYFEVAKNPNAVFQVQTSSQTIEVLGTHFNVRDYADEAMKQTTLVEGKVKVISKGSSPQAQYLSPGEQITLINAELIKKTVDSKEVMAWLSNRFIFDNKPLNLLIKDLERWYGVEFVLPNEEIGKQGYYANLSRDLDLSAILNALSVGTQTKFSIVKRRVYVNP
ncbi:FecR family protein [Sphingobacterium lactis]|uniref:FecR family protein n=1 Tax=Sphingobacterium lactis TaxID=797291 RepID=UPI003F7E630C